MNGFKNVLKKVFYFLMIVYALLVMGLGGILFTVESHGENNQFWIVIDSFCIAYIVVIAVKTLYYKINPKI